MKKTVVALVLCILPLAGIESGAGESKQQADVIKSILNEETGDRAPDKKKISPAGADPLIEKNKIDSLRPAQRKRPADSARDGEKKGSAGSEDAPAQISNEEQVLFKTGVDFYNSGMYEHALKKFQELAAKFPKTTLIDGSRAWMGKSDLKLYKYDDAIKEFSAIPVDSPEYPTAVYYTGESFQMKGDRLSAIENFEKLFFRFPQNELADKAVLNAGKLYLAQNKGAQALDAAIKLIKHYKDKDTIDDAYYLLAKIFENDATLKDIETARKIYRLFIKKGETDERFGKSPLKKRVEQDLARIERTYFKLDR